jgi:hypothetical protein
MTAGTNGERWRLFRQYIEPQVRAELRKMENLWHGTVFYDREPSQRSLDRAKKEQRRMLVEAATIIEVAAHGTTAALRRATESDSC